MKLFRLSTALVALLAVTASVGHAGSLVLNLSTTAAPATPLYGASWDGSAIVGDDYGVNFRDYQFNLTASPNFSFSDLIVQINADAQNRVAGSVMGVTIWAGPSITNAAFTNALGTLIVSATNWTGPGFQTIDWGPGGIVPSQTITTLPNEFFIRVWGTGANSPQGFKAKLAGAVDWTYATNTSPGVTLSNYDGTNYSPALTFDYTGPVPPDPGPAVPEPGTWAMAGLLVLTAGYIRWRRRAVAA